MVSVTPYLPQDASDTKVLLFRPTLKFIFIIVCKKENCQARVPGPQSLISNENSEISISKLKRDQSWLYNPITPTHPPPPPKTTQIHRWNSTADCQDVQIRHSWLFRHSSLFKNSSLFKHSSLFRHSHLFRHFHLLSVQTLKSVQMSSLFNFYYHSFSLSRNSLEVV